MMARPTTIGQLLDYGVVAATGDAKVWVGLIYGNVPRLNWHSLWYGLFIAIDRPVERLDVPRLPNRPQLWETTDGWGQVVHLEVTPRED